MQVLYEGPVSGDDAKRAAVVRVEWPVGSATGWHTHPGDEYATVLRGEVEVKTSKGVRVYKAGEAYHNPRGLEHVTFVVGSVPAETVAVMIVDKDKPLSEPMK